MESGNVAEWWAIGASGLVGVLGLLSAGRANRRAKEAVEEAKRANRLSGSANTIAKRSNEIAVEANEIAQETQTLSERQAAVQNREATVEWEGDWEEPGLYRVVNVGYEPALNITAKIGVDQLRGEAVAERVDPGKHFDVWMPEVREEYLREEEARARPQTGHPFLAAASFRSPIENLHYLSEFIVYSTEDGKQLTHKAEYKLASIDPR